MMSLQWMAARPSASCSITRRPRSGVSGPLPSVWSSVSPSANSITRQVAVLRRAEVDDPDHRRVLHAREQARLAAEALAHPRLLAHLTAEHLQGDPSPEADLLRQVHLAHAATSEVTQHAEAFAQDE